MLITHLKEFTGLCDDEVIEMLTHGAEYVKLCWNLSKPSTPEEIKRFYQTTDAYLYDLAYWHMGPNKRHSDQYIADKLSRLPRVLDWGCGIGDNSIALARRCVHVTAVDLESKTLDFCRYRVEKLGLGEFIDIIPNTTKGRGRIAHLLQKKGRWNAVLAMDVIEHMPTWEEAIELAKYLKTLAKPNNKKTNEGIFYTLPAGDVGGLHPMHLPMNKEAFNEVRRILEG